jgi:hypothetical protein
MGWLPEPCEHTQKSSIGVVLYRKEHDQRSQDFGNFVGVIFVQMVVFI